MSPIGSRAMFTLSDSSSHNGEEVTNRSTTPHATASAAAPINHLPGRSWSSGGPGISTTAGVAIESALEPLQRLLEQVPAQRRSDQRAEHGERQEQEHGRRF